MRALDQLPLFYARAQEIRDLSSTLAVEYSNDLKDHALTGFRLQKMRARAHD